MEPAVVAAAAVFVLLVVALARLVAVLDGMELTLRRLVSGVRRARQAVVGATGYATEVGRTVTEGERALSNLEQLKRTGRSGSDSVPSGEGGIRQRASTRQQGRPACPPRS